MGVMSRIYDAGTGSPFGRTLLQNLNIRDHAIQGEAEKRQFDERYSIVSQNLYEALLVKDKCIEQVKTHIDKVNQGTICSYNSRNGVISVDETVDNDVNLYFKDFFIRGNMAFEGLQQLGDFLGYNVKFAFADTTKSFEEGKKKFLAENPGGKVEGLIQVFEGHRGAWYQQFIKHRNAIEHRGSKYPKINYVLDENDKVKVLFPVFAKRTTEQLLDLLYENLLSFCEDTVVSLLSLKLPPDKVIIIMPEDQRDPANPAKYRVGLRVNENGKESIYPIN